MVEAGEVMGGRGGQGESGSAYGGVAGRVPGGQFPDATPTGGVQIRQLRNGL